MRRIVLASASARRKALLEQIGLTFTVDTRIQEAPVVPGADPHEAARQRSLLKAQSVAGRHPDAIIIAADTFGVLDGQVLGKPQSESEARVMLEKISGRRHMVITGFAVMDTANGKTVSRSAETAVDIKHLTRSEIEGYVRSGEPLGKAGGYAIQGLGAAIVERIDGDYYNVVGLPLCALSETLKEFGVNVL